jgi:thymidylate synthase (FAD)
MIDKIDVLGNSFVRYIRHNGSDSAIVDSARISYNGSSKGEEQDKKLLKYLFKNSHTSPAEMVNITFNIRMPIFVMRQFVRHRTMRLNEASFRYTEADFGFYIPEKWRIQDTKNKQGSLDSNNLDHTNLTNIFQKQTDECFKTYHKLLNDGVSREMARMILPLNTLTEIIVNCDMNNLLKFFKLRDDSHAQYEIQEIARAMKTITKQYFPWTMEIYEELNNK